MVRRVLARLHIAEGTHRYTRWRARFYGAAGGGFLLLLHGAGGALKVLTVLGLNFGLMTVLRHRGRWAPACLWALNLAILYGNELYDGYRWGSVPGLAGSAAARWLDERGGMVKWAMTWNMATLRVVSWGMDYWWKANCGGLAPPSEADYSLAVRQRTAVGRLTIQPTPAVRIIQKMRSRQPRPQREYSNFVLLLAYVAYPPTYITGPTLTFNSFASQVALPQHAVRWRGKLLFVACRALANLLVMEVFQHCVYSFAMIKRLDYEDNDRKNLLLKLFDGRLFLFFMFSVFALLSIWLKFLVIWRLARAWAILDDMDVPENMRFCIILSTSIARFWRDWHASYNEWLLRYVYVPLGGSHGSVVTRALAIGAVFVFVGFWHDRTLQLLAWAWLSIVFMVVEVLLRFAVSGMRAGTMSRWLVERGVGAAFTAILIVTNLVGFSYSLGGTGVLLDMMRHGGVVPSLVVVLTLLAINVVRTIMDACEQRKNPEGGPYLPPKLT